MYCAMQGLRAALEIVCILALVGSRSPLLAGCLVLASPLAAPAIKALSGAIQSASRDAQLAAATTASAADEVSIGMVCVLQLGIILPASHLDKDGHCQASTCWPDLFHLRAHFWLVCGL